MCTTVHSELFHEQTGLRVPKWPYSECIASEDE